MSKIWWVLNAGALLLLSWGCSPTYPECHNDEHCSSRNEVCVNGRCTQCRDDSHCGANPCSACINYACGNIPGCCTTDADCPGGRCWNGRCGAQCGPDLPPCPPGHICQNGSCVAVECGPDKPCPPGQRCVNNSCVGACEVETVYFDYKESNIRLDQQDKMRQNAECLKGQAGVGYRLTGHTDVRGTEEYNLALSEDRAKSVRRYLQNLGVSNSFSLTPMGEERPTCTRDSSESCHQENRRVEFVQQ